MGREAQSEVRRSYAVSRKAVAETLMHHNSIYGVLAKAWVGGKVLQNREDIEHVSGRVSKDLRGKDFPMVVNLDGVRGNEHDYCVALPGDELDLAVKRMEHIIRRGSPLTNAWDKVLDSLGFKRACGTFVFGGQIPLDKVLRVTTHLDKITNFSPDGTIYKHKPDCLSRSICNSQVDDLLVKGISDQLFKHFNKKCAIGIFLSEEKYAMDILKKYGMDRCKEVAAPIVRNAKLSKGDGDAKANPSLAHLIMESGMPNQEIFLQGCTDSDWAGCMDASKSTGSYVFTLALQQQRQSSRSSTVADGFGSDSSSSSSSDNSRSTPADQ
ncbi:hypothetical protein SLEP1_g25011 [Rubroshorea leprosula]|uniref:Uncharacterized protein n=1 Tax=Rubroshorea leprosula TaxID=152421 RepID=A0AAV5JPR6_9ROSI|nr:hypothetical protein SLEP1_g25011 [Rubroshorea leprosula]